MKFILFRCNKGMNNNFSTLLVNVLSDFDDISYVVLETLHVIYNNNKKNLYSVKSTNSSKPFAKSLCKLKKNYKLIEKSIKKIQRVI